MKSKRNISIVWDFDGTLTPDDSTSKIVEYFYDTNEIEKFWQEIKKINGAKSKLTMERILSSDSPTWMFVLSRTAFHNETPLTKEFFSKRKITNLVKLYPNISRFFKKIKSFEKQSRFKKSNVRIHNFIITAGLKEYVEALVPKRIFSNIWGCRYSPAYRKGYEDDVESVPVFCMDQTMKTRALYEISKGVFVNESKSVNDKVIKGKFWSPFSNFIYIGDGPTDVPALSLTRAYGGYGIVVFNPDEDKKIVKDKLKKMSADSRCDLITKANFSVKGDLFNSIENRCYQILEKYEAEDFSK